MAVLVFLTIPGLVLALVAFAAVDRMGLWAHRRIRLPWIRDGERAMSAPGLDELHAIFYAGKRHEIDQRRTSLVLRDEEGDGSLIDLDGGTALLRHRRR
ncbi:hypothetical protein DPM19_29755 [Actinomadura craniellae]|uniref:Uncharacterized protein n=1 Tax=Actinomadura craniellae TaxID=2231787 RepID=A0A365GZX2_9ACTN|nr:DUF6191 domain-containing protein [Actinomadura craniellae]RAY11493.1 hypothetical protein DPM19_29755 [Actinomadura craniellae]